MVMNIRNIQQLTLTEPAIIYLIDHSCSRVLWPVKSLSEESETVITCDGGRNNLFLALGRFICDNNFSSSESEEELSRRDNLEETWLVIDSKHEVCLHACAFYQYSYICW